MTERPILFNDQMVRAILEGRKTQTRRIVRPQPVVAADLEPHLPGAWEAGEVDVECPFGEIRDWLWVRERWWHYRSAELEKAGFDGGTITNLNCCGPSQFYPSEGFNPANHANIWRCRPSIHMPRWASRITLEITEVRVELLQAISEEDARDEGADVAVGGAWLGKLGSTQAFHADLRGHRGGFALLWESINGAGAWDANPWVWAISFRRLSGGGQ